MHDPASGAKSGPGSPCGAAGRGYSVLIRTFNSAATLQATLACLAAQSWPPSQYVIVDSGSTDGTLDLLPPGAAVHSYVGETFNYSSALNQGIDRVEHDYTLIISSHTGLTNASAVAFAVSLVGSGGDVAAAYFLPGEAREAMDYQLIDERSFTGFNGVFNTCALFDTSVLRKRRFRPEVFSAEDQEWSRWLLESEKKRIARISGAGMVYRNPIRDRRDKDFYEELAVALYVKPRMLKIPYLLRIMYRIVRPVSDFKRRRHHLRLLKALIYYRLTGIPERIDIFSKDRLTDGRHPRPRRLRAWTRAFRGTSAR